MFASHAPGSPKVPAEKAPEGTVFSIKEAAEYLGVSEMRVRTLLREGKLDGAEKISVGDTAVEKWMIPAEACDSYKENKGTFGASGRTPKGGKAHVIRIKGGPKQYEALKAFCDAQDPQITIELRYHYDVEKRKAYQAKRNAEKRAAKAAAGKPNG